MSLSDHPEEAVSRRSLSGRFRLNLAKMDQALRMTEVIDRKVEALSHRPEPKAKANGLDHEGEEDDSPERKDT